jgi:transcriptional regulator with PAS, ATPase and Fis domain
MKETHRDAPDTTNGRLSLISSLVENRDFKSALAEIRDLENQPDAAKSGEFLYLSALVLQRIGNYKEALLRAREAYRIYRCTNENKKMAKIQSIIGILHSDLGNLRESESELRDALATYRRIGDERGMIETHNELARVHFVQGEYEKSLEYLRRGLEYSKKMEDIGMIARFSGNVGTTQMLVGRWKEARQNLLTSLRHDEAGGNAINMCCWYLSLGYVSYLLRDFSNSQEYYEAALRLIYANNYTREMAIYYEYYGELAFTQGNYSLAKDYYRNGIKIGEEIAPDSGIVSQIYRLLAEVQIAEKEYDQVLSSCDRAMKVATSLGEKIEIGAIHRALGQIHTARGERQKAKENFDKSISILQQIGAKYELGKAYLEAVKSSAYEYVDRVAHFARGREVFKELESDYHVAMITLAFCEFLCERGEHEKAEVHLTDAERTLKRLKEKKDLDSILELRSRIDKALGRIGAPGTKHKTEYHFSDVVTRDPQMLALIEQARKFKDADVPILVEGETGTGKDLLAKVIHCESKRKDKRFVKVNCAAIPDSLLESELFGYRRGAFSGADREKRGLLEEADGGTILLNEIGDLPLRLQAKILDVIEDKEVSRLGEVRPRKVDFRVMAATNKNLSEEVRKGNFRKDLYHRLNVVTLRLPPLRERDGDIPLLIEHFLAKNNLPVDMEQLNIDQLLDYHWPGNVRELENEIRRYTSVADLIDGLSRWDKGSDQSDSGPQDPNSDKLTEMEKRRIIEAIRKVNGKQEAAELLGISLATLYRKIKLYGLDL